MNPSTSLELISKASSAAALIPRVVLVVTVSAMEVGSEHAQSILAKAADLLTVEGIDLVSPTVLDNAASARVLGNHLHGVDAICVIGATWSEDDLVQDLLACSDESAPIIAWAIPGLHTGSLCGTQQLCCVLKELDYPYRFVYGELDDPRVVAEVRAISSASAARRALRRSRVARIGARMAGMSEVALDEIELRSLFGVRLIERGLDWLLEQVESADLSKADGLWTTLRKAAGRVNVSDADGVLAMRYYIALRDFVMEEAVCALTTECYPKLMGKVCLPIAMLAEEGVVGACEGDVNSAVVMRMLSWFTGKPVNNTDILADYPEENVAIFSHCGSGALSLARCRDDVVLDNCRLSNIGVTVQYPGRVGRVTLVNLVGRNGTYRLSVVSGEALQTELVFPGNPVKVKLDVPVNAFLVDAAELGIGHHWMIGEGDVTIQFREFGKLTGIPVHYPGKH